MYYEVYADSLLLLHFFLNFYLLALMNRILYQVASCRRLLLGALLGTLCSVIPIILPIPLRLGLMGGFLFSVWVMCTYSFRVVERKQLLKIVEKMVVITLVLGGALRLMLRYVNENGKYFPGIVGVVMLASMVYWISGRLLVVKNTQGPECKVILHNGGERLEINALLDTGNTLVEPISGRPVSVTEPEILTKMLGGELPEGYRVVPFCSVGKRHGLIKAYLVKSVLVEVEGVCKECKNIYVGENQEFFNEGSQYQMILNPGILEGE